MKLPLEYKALRGDRHKLVIELVSNAGLSGCLRGSWVTGDFHVSIIDGLSFSDIDLASTKSLSIPEETLLMIATNFTAAGFPLRVSAHEEKSLKQVNLEDWRVLKVCEYISKLPIVYDNPNLISYWRAKTALLLLQIKVDEGCENISNRINTVDSKGAFAVKLGVETNFSIASAARLIQSYGDDIANEFLEQCLITSPSVEYIQKIKSQLRICQSVSPWLQEYVLKKMSMFKR